MQLFRKDVNPMRRRMRNMLILLAILFGCIFLYKAVMGFIIKRAMSANVKIISVSTMKVGPSLWQPKLAASGSLRAIRGVNVTTELAGLVQTIYFTPGAMVKEGSLLIQLNADNDIALLHSLQANAELAKITYLRDKAQYAIEAVSKAQVDTDTGTLKSDVAQVAQQAAIVAKKTIRAPFSGRLGVSQVNPGQYLNTGDPVVMLQTLDPIWTDFYVPQQEIGHLKVGLPVNVISDSFPGKIFTGKITTINPAVDATTRNVEVEATISNPKYALAPGMFASVEVITGPPKAYLTLPLTAISFNPYGELVFVVRQTGTDKDNKPILTATQVFIKTGETRGDQVTVLQGLKEGDMVVTSGQLKLKNGSRVAINNSVVPENSPTPKAPDEY